MLLLSSPKVRFFHTFCVLCQTPPVQEQTVACISRGKHNKKSHGALSVQQVNYISPVRSFCLFYSTSSSNTKSMEVSTSLSWSFNEQHAVQALWTPGKFVWWVYLSCLLYCSTCVLFLFNFFCQVNCSLACVIEINAFFFLEPSTIWLIWKSLPVHPFATVGKSKH